MKVLILHFDISPTSKRAKEKFTSMVWQTYGLHAGGLSRTRRKSRKRRTQTATNKGLSAGLTEITETTEIIKTMGIRTGSPKNGVF